MVDPEIIHGRSRKKFNGLSRKNFMVDPKKLMVNPEINHFVEQEKTA